MIQKIRKSLRDIIRAPLQAGIKGGLVRLPSKISLLSRPKALFKNSRLNPLEVLRKSKPRKERELKEAYQNSELSNRKDTFVLYRIIGNDLVPRHKKGQCRENLRFILEHENALPLCEKRWIVNRIFDKSEEKAIIDLLETHQQKYIHITFNSEEYRKVEWDFSSMPSLNYISSKRFGDLDPAKQERAITALYRLKNNYVMHNNGARNAALRDGRNRAKWVLPWDGNCFVTPEAWTEITESISRSPHLKYFAVPMERVTDNSVLLGERLTVLPLEEPQLIFRCDAIETFNESFPYGRRPKVELFWRLGIPGPWDRWSDDPWDPARRGKSPDYRQFGVAGWVARMFSGMKTLEEVDTGSFKNRGLARQVAIRAAINHIDRQNNSDFDDPFELTIYSFAALRKAREALSMRDDHPLKFLAETVLRDAESALATPPYAVTQKTTLPPSGDIKDYWHPAPYWWPNPKTSNGLPYVWKDGQRVPGTRMFEPASDQYDRTRLQLMFNSSTCLAIAWALTDCKQFAQQGARLVRTWFIDQSTRMNPHLRYAQVRMGHDNNEGAATGIIEFKDLYYFLDAVRLLEVAGTFTSEDTHALKNWLSLYLEWLETSPQGKKEVRAPNNHGTYYDLQVAAINAYLGQTEKLCLTLLRAASRIPGQFTCEGGQPEEMKRSITQHYCFFNLQGWLNLLNLATAAGFPTNSIPLEYRERLKKACLWTINTTKEGWPYEQIEPFDHDRIYPLAASAKRLGLLTEEDLAEHTPHEIKSIFNPHEAIHPYWNLYKTPFNNATLINKHNRIPKRHSNNAIHPK